MFPHWSCWVLRQVCREVQTNPTCIQVGLHSVYLNDFTTSGCAVLDIEFKIF